MLVRELMSTDVVTVDIGATLDEAVDRQLRQAKVQSSCSPTATRPARAVHVHDFCDWIRYKPEAELARRREIEMNSVGVPDAYASVAS